MNINFIKNGAYPLTYSIYFNYVELSGEYVNGNLSNIDYLDIYSFFESNGLIISPKLFQTSLSGALYLSHVIHIYKNITIFFVMYLDKQSDKICWSHPISEDNFTLYKIRNNPLNYDQTIKESIKFAFDKLENTLEFLALNIKEDK